MASPHTSTMAENESSLFHLELIRRRNLSEQETNILNALACGMQPATTETAVEAACRQLDGCCPPLSQEKEANDYLWMVWEIMLDIVRSPDVTSGVHEGLVGILESLRQTAKGDLNVWGSKLRVWKDLPLLPMCMEAYFNGIFLGPFLWRMSLICLAKDPISATGEFTPKSAQIWRNLNTFGARCLGAGIAGPYYQAMYALRSALEEELSTVGEVNMTECRIQVACEWISHAAKPLLWWARDNIGYMNVTMEDEANYVERGTLYHGPPTMCLQRWGFWLDRFEELGKEESGMSEGIRKVALEAAQTMRTIERGIANTLPE